MKNENLMDIRHLGLVDFQPTYTAMQEFTASRALKTAPNTNRITAQPNEYAHNQLWICEHPVVYTQGLAGKAEHVLSSGNIPVVQTDRGGEAAKKPGKMTVRNALQNSC